MTNPAIISTQAESLLNAFSATHPQLYVPAVEGKFWQLVGAPWEEPYFFAVSTSPSVAERVTSVLKNVGITAQTREHNGKIGVRIDKEDWKKLGFLPLSKALEGLNGAVTPFVPPVTDSISFHAAPPQSKQDKVSDSSLPTSNSTSPAVPPLMTAAPSVQKNTDQAAAQASVISQQREAPQDSGGSGARRTPPSFMQPATARAAPVAPTISDNPPPRTTTRPAPSFLRPASPRNTPDFTSPPERDIEARMGDNVPDFSFPEKDDDRPITRSPMMTAARPNVPAVPRSPIPADAPVAYTNRQPSHVAAEDMAAARRVTAAAPPPVLPAAVSRPAVPPPIPAKANQPHSTMPLADDLVGDAEVTFSQASFQQLCKALIGLRLVPEMEEWQVVHKVGSKILQLSASDQQAAFTVAEILIKSGFEAFVQPAVMQPYPLVCVPVFADTAEVKSQLQHARINACNVAISYFLAQIFTRVHLPVTVDWEKAANGRGFLIFSGRVPFNLLEKSVKLIFGEETELMSRDSRHHALIVFQDDAETYLSLARYFALAQGEDKVKGQYYLRPAYYSLLAMLWPIAPLWGNNWVLHEEEKGYLAEITVNRQQFNIDYLMGMINQQPDLKEHVGVLRQVGEHDGRLIISIDQELQASFWSEMQHLLVVYMVKEALTSLVSMVVGNKTAETLLLKEWQTGKLVLDWSSLPMADARMAELLAEINPMVEGASWQGVLFSLPNATTPQLMLFLTRLCGLWQKKMGQAIPTPRAIIPLDVPTREWLLEQAKLFFNNGSKEEGDVLDGLFGSKFQHIRLRRVE
ncbi:MAG: hypothetical protein ACOYK8_01660 [Alphaproteobacteria bacterium]